LKVPQNKQLRIKARPGVKSKTRTKSIEMIGKHPDGWDLVKESSPRWMNFMRLSRDINLGIPTPSTEAVAIIGCLINFLQNRTTQLPPHPYHDRRFQEGLFTSSCP
jgi:hypothetical protein